MRLQDFIFECVDGLRSGDVLRKSSLLPMLNLARDRLEAWEIRITEDPQPEGLEALDEAVLEALDRFAEALDYLELATTENIPELADSISALTQDAIDTLRHAYKQAQRHSTMLTNEVSWEEG